jgi:hypothetical protein
MKKLLYTFLAVSLIFSACKKEEDTTITSNYSITGLWNQTEGGEGDVEGYYTNYPNGRVITKDESVFIPATLATALGFFRTLEFISNGDYEEYGGPFDVYHFLGSWQKSNDTLIINKVDQSDFVNVTEIIQINELSVNRLVLQMNTEDTIHINDTVFFDEDIEIAIFEK